MTRRLLPFFAATTAIAVMTIPTWAGSNSNGSISATIDLDSTTNISNAKLDPGEYRVVAEGTQARFEKDGKTVAEVPCTLKTLSSKASQTQFSVDSGRLTEIQVSGKTQAIEFSPGHNSGN